MTSVYQLEQAMAALISARARLIDEDPELARDEAALTGCLQGEGLDLLDNVLRASIHARGMAEAAETLAKAINARRDRYKARAEALRQAAFAAMDALGMTRRELPDMTVTIAAGKPGVVITDEALIPDDLIRVTRAPDRTAIRAALDQGAEVPGATLANGLPTMTVRTR